MIGTGLMILGATVGLFLPVTDMTGRKVDDCRVQVGDGGMLTLTCAGNEPMLLDYRVGAKERFPKIRVERAPEGKVTKVLIQPAREVDWRPVAWVVLTVGAVFMGGHWMEDSEDQDKEKSVSPWR